MPPASSCHRAPRCCLQEETSGPGSLCGEAWSSTTTQSRAWSGSRVKGVPCRLLRGRGCSGSGEGGWDQEAPGHSTPPPSSVLCLVLGSGGVGPGAGVAGGSRGHTGTRCGGVWHLPGRWRREGHPPALRAPPPRNGLLSGLQQLANAPTVADVLGERTPVSYTWKPQEPAPC